MKYLAFDIEAANGYMLSSICSVGVVIADERFDIVSRENIWINPRTEYNLNGTRPNVGINLHLDPKLLSASPDFKRVYPRLKALLTDPQYVVVGHAADSDVRMLNKACLRYRLKGIDFSFVCTQLLYKLYKGEKEVKALGKIAEEIGFTFTQHNSEEDAYASLMTLKYLVEQSGLSVAGLMEKYHVRYGSNIGMELTRPASLDGQGDKNLTRRAIDGIKRYLATVKMENDLFKDKVFCLARSLELGGGQQLNALLQKIARCGGRYSSKLLKGNYYVLSPQPTPTDVMREKRVEELAAQGLMKKVSVNDVLEERL